MRPHVPRPSRVSQAIVACTLLAALALPALSPAAPRRPQPARARVTATGTLMQLSGRAGCVVASSARGRAGCTPVRALDGPAPFLGSDAVAISPDGRNVYVAASDSDAIAIFARNARSGALTQRSGAVGCIAARGAAGCAPAIGLDGPNSVAVSPDGANVYATSLQSDTVAVFRRDATTGALVQSPDGSGCVAGRAPIPGCLPGRALDGPDVVAVSPDGATVYVASFVGNAISVFARNPSGGGLTQAADASGCVVAVATANCSTALALGAPEGLAVSADGASVYVASAVGNALLTFTRNPAGGALTQATDGSGCVVASPLTGCTTGVQLAGANAVAISPGDDEVYVTSLMSDSVTSFARASGGALTQLSGTSACVVQTLAVGCSLGRALSAPEGIAVSPDGASVYAAAFASGAVAVLDRTASSGALMQKPRRAGCVVSGKVPDCAVGRALVGASAVVVSPDGKNVYVAGFKSDALSVFKRVTKAKTRAQR